MVRMGLSAAWIKLQTVTYPTQPAMREQFERNYARYNRAMLWTSNHEFYLLVSKTRQKLAVRQDRPGWATPGETLCHSVQLDFSVPSRGLSDMTSYCFLENLGLLYSGNQRKCSKPSWAWQALKRIINVLRGITGCLTHLSALTQDQTYLCHSWQLLFQQENP